MTFIIEKKRTQRTAKLGKYFEVYFKYIDQSSTIFQDNFSCVSKAGKILFQPEIKHTLKNKQNTLRLVTCWSSGDIAHSVLSFHLSTVCYLHL